MPKAMRKVASKKAGHRRGRNPQTEAWPILETTVLRPRGGGRGRGKPLPRREGGMFGRSRHLNHVSPRGLVGLTIRHGDIRRRDIPHRDSRHRYIRHMDRSMIPMYHIKHLLRHTNNIDILATYEKNPTNPLGDKWFKCRDLPNIPPSLWGRCLPLPLPPHRGLRTVMPRIGHASV